MPGDVAVGVGGGEGGGEEAFGVGAEGGGEGDVGGGWVGLMRWFVFGGWVGWGGGGVGHLLVDGEDAGGMWISGALWY